MLNNYGEVIKYASLLNYNSYGIDTTCDYLIKPSSIEDLVELLNYLKTNNIKYYILGKGSNVLLPDTHFKGVIISLEELKKVEFDKEIVTAECGVVLGLFINNCINNELKGLEHLALIPGTLGGALYGNAGVKEHTIYDNLVNIEVIRDNKIILLEKKDIDISYRYTMFKENDDVLVKATFKLEKGNGENLKSVVKENRLKRLETQPLEYKNAGSVFRNPETAPAGKLIESVGLKGYKIGDAEISTKHANFIINKGNAKSSDIRELIKLIKEKVYEKYQIELVLEQIIIDWD